MVTVVLSLSSMVNKTCGYESETNHPLSKPARVPCPSLNPMTETARFMGEPVGRSPEGWYCSDAPSGTSFVQRSSQNVIEGSAPEKQADFQNHLG